MRNVLIVVFGLLATCLVIEHCANSNKKYIKSLGWPNYVVELEDGYQYIENRNYHNLSLTHYIDCPKCQKDTTSNDSLL